MANTIQIKRRTDATNTNALGTLSVGELGVDLTDSNKLYVGTSSGNVLTGLPTAGGTLTGSLTTGGDITINKGNATLRLNDTTNGHDFVIFSNGSELRMAVNGASFPSAYLNLTTGGNLGLGVTGASERLEVSGKAIFTDAVSVGQSSAPSGNNKFEVYNTSGNYNAVFKNSGQATLEIQGGENSSARIRLIPDEGDDANNADHFQLIHETSNNFELQRYVLNSGWEWKWKLDSSNNVHQTGNLTASGTATVGENVNAAGLVVKRANSGDPYIQFNKGNTRHAYIQSYQNKLYVSNDNASDILFRTQNSDNLILYHGGTLFSNKGGDLGTNASRWSTIYGAAGDFSGNLTVSGSCTFAALSGTTGSFSGDITITNGIKLARTSQYENLISCEDSGGNQTLKILGNRAASNASTGTDVRIGGEQDRTTGNAFEVVQGSSTYLQISSSGAATFFGNSITAADANFERSLGNSQPTDLSLIHI